MISSFFKSYSLKNTYRVNTILYTLKNTPIIGKLLPYSLYNNRGLKIFSNVLSFIVELLSIFFGKFLYILICFVLVMPFYGNQQLAFINIIVFLTLIGAFLNTNIFNPSMDKYYAIVLMRFDAKRYTIVNYIYFLLSCFIGFIPFIFLFGLKFNVDFIICLLIPFFVISVKNITNMFTLKSYKKKLSVYNENKFKLPVILGIVLFLGLAYGLPIIGIGINNSIFLILFVLSFVFGVYSFIYILKYNNYNFVCKELLKDDDVISNDNVIDSSYKKQINNELVKKNDKVGYAYLNDIFVQRHKKLLYRATKRISIVLIFLFVLLFVVVVLFPNKNSEINNLLQNSLPYYLFIMYFINRGQKICQTMFMNCDHSMLTYRFFRQSNAILSLFEERLKVLIKLNIIPGFILACGTLGLLYLTGGYTLWGYVISFLTIICMSIFFSIHYLVLYYLLQPYDVNLNIKNPLFSTICGFTYFVCYLFTQIQVPTYIFGAFMCLFTILYSVISLYLSYKYAPKTFKLRIN